MRQKAFAELQRATYKMSFPVMVALLGSIHDRLRENDEMTDVADHVREAMSLLFEKHEQTVTPMRTGQPN